METSTSQSTPPTDPDRVQLPEWMTSSAPRSRDYLRRRPITDRVGRGLKWLVPIVVTLVLVVPAGLVFWTVATRSGNDPNYIEMDHNPFLATPADRFAEGSAGIEIPPAHAEGPFSAEEVAAALDAVRQALIAGHLDHRMLLDHDPEGFLTLIAPDQRDDLRADFTDSTGANYTTRITPGAEVSEWLPRVRGRITYRSTVDDEGTRILEITTKFVWVYHFAKPAAGFDRNLVTTVDEIVWHVPHADDVSAGSQGLWLINADAVAWDTSCTAYRDGFISPRLPGEMKPSEVPGADIDPGERFDPEQPLIGAYC